MGDGRHGPARHPEGSASAAKRDRGIAIQPRLLTLAPLSARLAPPTASPGPRSSSPHQGNTSSEDERWCGSEPIDPITPDRSLFVATDSSGRCPSNRLLICINNGF